MARFVFDLAEPSPRAPRWRPVVTEEPTGVYGVMDVWIAERARKDAEEKERYKAERAKFSRRLAQVTRRSRLLNLQVIRNNNDKVAPLFVVEDSGTELCWRSLYNVPLDQIEAALDDEIARRKHP